MRLPKVCGTATPPGRTFVVAGGLTSISSFDGFVCESSELPQKLPVAFFHVLGDERAAPCSAPCLPSHCRGAAPVCGRRRDVARPR